MDGQQDATPSGPPVPGQALEWMRDFAAAVRARDYPAGRALVVDAVIGFGTVAGQTRGQEDLEREQWRPVWEATSGFAFDVDAATAVAVEGLVCVAAPWSSTGAAPDGSPTLRHGRATLVLVPGGDRWRAAHTHFSLVP